MLSKLSIGKTYLNIIKATDNKPTTNILVNKESWKLSLQDLEQNKDAHFDPS
jgi:hypothetical protein